MDSCVELGTLVVWASLYGILSFQKRIFLFFVSIFHNRKAKLKQNGYMKQHC